MIYDFVNVFKTKFNENVKTLTMADVNPKWKEFWDKDELFWHSPEPNPRLLQTLPVLAPTSPQTFFLPMCGKTVDLVHLYRLGHRVIGCEYSEQGCRDVFREADLAFKMDLINAEQPEKGKVFTSADDGGRLRLVACDLFQMNLELMGGVTADAVFDRGALVAMDRDKRERYVALMKSLLSPEFRYGLVTFDYTPAYEEKAKYPEPPAPVTVEDAEKLFGSFCHVRVLTREIPSIDGFPHNDLVYDLVFLLTRKSEQGEEDRIDYWQRRWVDNTAMWHSQKPTPHLVRHWDKLRNGADPIRIFLPLCGKAGDLIWLYNGGQNVTGLEGVPYVAEAAFTDNNIPYKKSIVPGIDGGCVVFTSDDGRLRIFACDLFSITAEALGEVEHVYDRGSFEAINVVDRPRYVDLMFKLFGPTFRVVLNGYEYDASVIKGPPRSVMREEVRGLYEGAGAKVEVLEEHDAPERAKRFGLEKMTKVIYLITSK